MHRVLGETRFIINELMKKKIYEWMKEYTWFCEKPRFVMDR